MDLNSIKELVKTFAQSDVDEMHLTIDNISLKLTKFHSRANYSSENYSNNDSEYEESSVKKVTKTSVKQDENRHGNKEKAEKKEDSAKDEDLTIHMVKSPIIGTFYSSPAPGEKSFVHIGQTVKKGDILCIIEAMKVMNKIESDSNGTILEILCLEETPVEYGTPLFKIKKA